MIRDYQKALLNMEPVPFKGKKFCSTNYAKDAFQPKQIYQGLSNIDLMLTNIIVLDEIIKHNKESENKNLNTLYLELVDNKRKENENSILTLLKKRELLRNYGEVIKDFDN